jgi:hypothetical protein
MRCAALARAPGRLASQKGKKSAVKFTINCTAPVADEIFDIASFVSSLRYDLLAKG